MRHIISPIYCGEIEKPQSLKITDSALPAAEEQMHHFGLTIDRFNLPSEPRTRI